MKKYLIIQLIFIGLFGQFIEAMDAEQESQKPFSLCRQILTIDPDAPAADYKALAQRLHETKLSTCECATYLAQEKKQKALRALKKEGFLSEQGIKRINKFQDAVKKIDEPLNKLVVEIPEDLPEDIKKEIIDHFSPSFSSIKFKVENNFQTGAGISYILPSKLSNLKKTLSNITFEHSLLVIADDIQDISPLGRKLIFFHEKQHIVSRHNLVKKIIHKEIKKLRRKDNRAYRSFPYKIFNKFSRAHETEADLIPTACGSCDDAYSAVEYFEDLPKDNRKNDGTHPSNRTRYQRAQRIYKLKLAEEKLTQKEDPELL